MDNNNNNKTKLNLAEEGSKHKNDKQLKKPERK